MQADKKTKLLIVDDLEENLTALEAIIRGPDREVLKASSGVEALELLLLHTFALAIIDVEMPEMDGFHLAELMRGTEKTRHIPIVFVTAAGNELNYAFKGYEAGAVDFLHKPLDMNAVRSKTSIFIELFQHRLAIEQQLAALEKSRKEQAILLSELQSTQLELEHSLKMRDEFMSMVAHEMRTPLNTLFLEVQLRQTQLKKNNLEAFSPDQLDKMLQRSDRQLRSIIRLIEDMLDVSRIKNGKLSIKPVATNLSELVARVVADLTPCAKESGAVILAQTEPVVSGVWDAFRIEQIITNLLTNAIRYGRGKPIQVRVTATAQEASVEVEDQGLGIAPEDQARIFDPFERAANTHVKCGLGLGLYISRQLAEAHHGVLQLNSRKEQGSTFTLKIPLHVATNTHTP